MSKTTTYDVDLDDKTAKFALTQFSWDEFEMFWPGIEEMLDCVPHTWKHWTKDYIRDSIYRGTMQAWGIGPPPKAVLIFFTMIGVYPADRVLHVSWGAGHFDPAMIPTIEAALINYAQFSDCDSVEIRGRPGWAPHFKAAGMKKEYVAWSYNVPKRSLN